jgi:predicted MFS family arabinose efflux permease
MLLGILVVPFGFLGGFWMGLAGALLWGLSLGVHEAVMSAAVARMVAEQDRPRAYGIFTAIFGIAWFVGSAAQGALYDLSIPSLVMMSVAAEIAAFLPLFGALRSLQGSAAGRG